MSVPTASSSSCRQRPPKFEKLEEAVNIWFAEMRSRGAAVSDEMLQEKAKEFGTTMGILVNSSAMEVEDPMDELPLAALREALRQLGEKKPDEEASAFLDIDEETNSWEPMSDEQIMELVGESAQQGHQLVENFAPTETDDEEERPTVTRCEARRGLETAIAYLEQEGDGERALQVAEVLRFLDTKVGSKASVQTHISSFFAK
ncbi:major centromere autoantigen B-like [Ixodes scapularis]